MSGNFIIKETNTGIKFDLKIDTGESIGSSEVYTTLQACKNGIESVKKNSVEASIEDQTLNTFAIKKNPKFEMYIDKRKQYRFRLKARNGEIILTSEAYQAKVFCEKGIATVKKIAPDAEVYKI